jgi:hypothetical protein
VNLFKAVPSNKCINDVDIKTYSKGSRVESRRWRDTVEVNLSKICVYYMKLIELVRIGSSAELLYKRF